MVLCGVVVGAGVQQKSDVANLGLVPHRRGPSKEDKANAECGRSGENEPELR
jgi:hypothetical protein